MEKAEEGGANEKQDSQEGDMELIGEMASGESRAVTPELCAHHLRGRLPAAGRYIKD